MTSLQKGETPGDERSQGSASKFPESEPLKVEDSPTEVIGKAADVLRPYVKEPARVQQIATKVVSVAESFSGPLPHPKHLALYENTIPGSGGKIVSMAEREQKHRHRLQTYEMFYPYLGQLLGFLGFLAAIFGAIYLALHDKLIVAGLLVGAPVVGAIGWFVKSRVSLGRTEESKPISETGKKNSPKKRR
ncbi:MAG: DUF2335 domain-containing protein [Roseomonas sp.]|nr:DUF2335 domain-containing protein [Roseomonas sp.]